MKDGSGCSSRWLLQPVAVATCDSNIWVLAAGPLAVAAGISSFSFVDCFLFFFVFSPNLVKHPMLAREGCLLLRLLQPAAHRLAKTQQAAIHPVSPRVVREHGCGVLLIFFLAVAAGQ